MLIVNSTVGEFGCVIRVRGRVPRARFLCQVVPSPLVALPSTRRRGDELATNWFAHMAATDRLILARVLPTVGRMETRKVRPAHIQAIVDAYAHGGAPRTVAQLRAATSSMFQFDLRGGLVTVNPVRAPQTPTPQKPDLVTPSGVQLRELIEAAVGTKWEIAVLIAGTTGARRAETLAVKWANVDLDRGRISIVETLQRVDGQLTFTAPKTGKSAREIPIPGFAVARLRAHKAAQAQRRLHLGAAWTDLDRGRTRRRRTLRPGQLHARLRPDRRIRRHGRCALA
jgi:integrase